MDSQPTVDLLEFDRSGLSEFLTSAGLSSTHTRNLWRGIYHNLHTDLEAVYGLPVRVSEFLQRKSTLRRLPVLREEVSTDGFTRKYLLDLGDGRAIETVLMRFTGRVTACLSTQAGCAMGCVFCATGQQGFGRHLSTAEIIAQALHVPRVLADEGVGQRLRNVVFMGMGEPLHNYEAVMQAAAILHDSGGFGLAADRISVSTVGVVPGILRLATEKRPVQLAVSLHGATQETRAALVPVARRWPLDELMQACRTYIAQTGKRIFYEWTLIRGVNDSMETARTLGRLLNGQYAQVNLIPLNPSAGYSGDPTVADEVRQFQQVLIEEFSLPSTIRQRRGIDIAAGCGQLAVG